MSQNSRTTELKIKLLRQFLYIFILTFFFSCRFDNEHKDIPISITPNGGVHYTLKIKANTVERGLEQNMLRLRASDDDLVFEMLPSIKSQERAHQWNYSNHDSLFAFKLIGLDTGFIKMPYPMIRYTNLKGGDYTFVYSFRLKDSIVEQQIIPVEIQETMNETWWFYPAIILFFVLVIGVVVYLWTMYEFRQKLKVASIRNRIAGDLHDEIGSDLGSVVLAIKAVQNKYAKDAPQLNDTLEEVKKEIKETSVTLRDSVWLIQPNNDSFEKLFDKIHSFAQRVLKAEQIDLVYNNQLQGKKDWKISMERRRNVYLIIREAIHNIVKHAQATQVQISITREEEGVQVVIADNGIGFIEEEIEESGNGLLNFRQRAKESYITFDLKSTPSVGTTISMFIPEF
jgi:two-component sensor histidine kinase